MRELLLKSLKSHAQGHLDKHIANVEILLEKGVGMANSTDIIDAIEHELDEVAKYHDQLEVLEKYFGNTNSK